jgi:integrase
MPTILKRGPYQWQAKIRRKGHPTQSKTFPSKAEAQAWTRELESEMDRNVFNSRAEAERTTLKEALDRYGREVTPAKKGADKELNRIKLWKARPIAARHLATIKGSDLAKHRDERRAEGRAENTIRLELALLSQVFETARKEWGMESLVNPIRNIRVPGGSKQRDRRLHGAEEQYLLNALKESDYPVTCAVSEFAVETAMRQSEILGLIPRAVNKTRQIATLADTKNGTARLVPLSGRALAILAAQGESSAHNRVFAIRDDRLRRVFAQACRTGRAQYVKDCAAQGVEPDKDFLLDLHFHDLRHEATTRLFERGLGLMEVAAITGHKTLSMLKRYTHLRPEDLAKKLASPLPANGNTPSTASALPAAA